MEGHFDMKKLAILYPIIAIISVAVMIIWGFTAQDWSLCWLSVFVGGCLMAILSIIIGVKSKEEKNNKKDK